MPKQITLTDPPHTVARDWILCWIAFNEGYNNILTLSRLNLCPVVKFKPV